MIISVIDTSVLYSKKKRKNKKNNTRKKARRKKDKIFTRDGNKCLNCGSGYDLTLDHIVPISKGGTSKSENLQTLCKICNKEKGEKIKNYRENLIIQHGN